MEVYSAVQAMKSAVSVAIAHGDIKRDVVCKGVGMSTSELMQWVNSRYVALSGESAKVQQLMLMCLSAGTCRPSGTREWPNG